MIKMGWSKSYLIGCEVSSSTADKIGKKINFYLNVLLKLVEHSRTTDKLYTNEHNKSTNKRFLIEVMQP